MCLRSELSKGMRKPGSLKEGGKIGVQQKGVLHVQGNNLRKPFAKQLGVTIIQLRYQTVLAGFSEQLDRKVLLYTPVFYH